MGSQIKLLGLFFFVVSFRINLVATQNEERVNDGNEVSKGIVHINGNSAIGNIDDDFVCATLDWWPPEKCDYGRCSWGLASLLNLVFFFFFFLIVLESREVKFSQCLALWVFWVHFYFGNPECGFNWDLSTHLQNDSS